MHTTRFVYIGLATLNLALVNYSLGQGSLTPPAGPGPTMKTLDQIDAKLEKRIPVSSLPFTITAPGSYYLTRNLTAPAGSAGITVKADDVTIDLDGFALLGAGNATGGAHGIVINATRKHLCVTNGGIRNFPDAGIGGDVSDARFERLTIGDNRGIGLLASNRCEIRDCVVRDNGAAGIRVGNSCLIVHVIASGNFAFGIRANDQNIIDTCTVTETLDPQTNDSYGIGVRFGNTVRNCVVRANGFWGIRCDAGNMIVDNLCDINGLDGIYVFGDANRLDGNSLTYNGGYGIYVPGLRNLVVRNTCRGNKNGAISFNTETTDVYGQIVDLSGAGGQIPNSAGPWSNIAY